MPVGKYLDPADNTWKPLPVPPHIHPGQTRIPGEVIAYAGSVMPAGWLLCDGSSFDPAVYPMLAAVLPAHILPDLRDRSVIGGGGTQGALLAHVGAATHGHVGDALPVHTHGAGPLAAHTHSIPAGTTTSDSHAHTINIAQFDSGAGGSHGHTSGSAGSHGHSTNASSSSMANATEGTLQVSLEVHTHSVNSGGSHSHTVNSASSHQHVVNPPSTASSSDAHSHTTPALNSGAMSAGTPNVADASAGTPSVQASSSYHPSTVLNYIIFTGA